MAQAQSCANHVQHSAYQVQHVVLRATWYEGTAQLLSLTELKLHLFELYFVGWIIKLMKQHITISVNEQWYYGIQLCAAVGQANNNNNNNKNKKQNNQKTQKQEEEERDSQPARKTVKQRQSNSEGQKYAQRYREKFAPVK